MPYDMTIFTTIAGASASFVAILGGFIVSKLIAINDERERITGHIKELDTEISLKSKEKSYLQERLDEEDALTFIREHSEELVAQKSVDIVYRKDEENIIKKEVLLPYWEKGIELVKRFKNANTGSPILNKDDIPKTLAEEISENGFEYDICCEIAAEIYPKRVRVRAVQVTWYAREQEKVEELEREVKFLSVKKEYFLEQAIPLKKPKGMGRGLFLFGAFSVFNIIQPLIFSVITGVTKNQYNAMILVAIFLFSVGLSSIFWHLSWLLKWKEEKRLEIDNYKTEVRK